VSKHIPLDRRFVPFDPKLQGERSDHMYGMGSISGPGTGWEEILAGSGCTVIIAEAGNGKTAELRHQASSLRAAGKAAFFVPLELLASRALERSLEIGTPDELRAWKVGKDQGYFFLDAADEAKLRDPRDFERAIRNFLEGIEAHKERVAAVVSTRPHAWQAYADKALLAELLGLPPVLSEPVSRQTPSGEGGEEEVEGPGGEEAERGASAPKSTEVTVLQMAPLDSARVRTFAKAKGVADVDGFMRAIERADADVFATRPADLPGLIKMWEETGRLGSYRDVVVDNIELKLAEENPAHRHHAIAADRATAGARLLAAAVTFTKRTSILVPDQPVDEDLKAISIDPQQVLKGWTPAEIQALLGRALFDEALYGTVRFHHRTAREYLAAQWLKGLLDVRKRRRAIERLLFARPYGSEPEVVIPSMKPVAGWLALWDPRVRDRVRRIDPTVLLEYGDVSGLDPDTRMALLREFASRYEHRKHTPVRLDDREVRRLADRDLAPVIRELLERYRDHEDVRILMLRIIREGSVTVCCDIATDLALDSGVDAYARACAVQCVGRAGPDGQKKAVASGILRRAASTPADVLAAIVETLWPAALSIGEVVKIAEEAREPEAYSRDLLEVQLERLVPRLSASDQLELLRGVVALLGRGPLDDGDYRKVSRRYAWLLGLAGALVQAIVAANDKPPYDHAALDAIALCEQADHLPRYSGGVEKKVAEIVRANRSLKHALFWHVAYQVRAESKEGLKDSWFAHMSPSLGIMEVADADGFIAAMKERPLPDDKLVALAALVTVYGQAGRPPELLARIRHAVAGEAALEAALEEHLTPRPAMLEYERKRAEREAKRQEEREKEEEDRKEWIARLRANPGTVGDLSIAPEGKVWRNTVWLFEEMREKGKGSSGSWTVARWELLEEEFGPEVAGRFKDFCVAFWRRYMPTLRSEVGGDSRSTPWPIIIGLSGLAMEARGKDWELRLSEDEVRRAVRYALWELNGFPKWFAGLARAHAKTVSEMLVTEMRWELRPGAEPGSAQYVLSRLRWASKDTALVTRDEIMELIESARTKDVTCLAEALTIILRDPAPIGDRFVRTVRLRASRAKSDGEKALWLAVLLCLDPEAAMKVLEGWVDAGRSPADREARLTLVLNHIWGNDIHSLNSVHQDYVRPGVLVRLLKLAYRHVRMADDIRHHGAVTPRHEAQEARGRLLELLCGIPGRPTYDALQELSRFHAEQRPKDRMLVLADRRAGADVEPHPWKPHDVPEFAEEAERTPETQQELFGIALSRLDDLKLEWEEGDESDARLVACVENEVELRLVVAGRLRQAAAGRYTPGSEEELANKKRTDVRLHSPAVDARIPIEIKIAGQWTADEMRERLENQLVKQYMGEARYGVFLVVNRGGKKDRKQWTIDGKRSDFKRVVARLQQEARSLAAKSSPIEGLEVVGIDLTKRTAQPRKTKSVVKSGGQKKAGKASSAPQSAGRAKRRTTRRGRIAVV
jgi:hypothetical protein